MVGRFRVGPRFRRPELFFFALCTGTGIRPLTRERRGLSFPLVSGAGRLARSVLDSALACGTPHWHTRLKMTIMMVLSHTRLKMTIMMVLSSFLGSQSLPPSLVPRTRRGCTGQWTPAVWRVCFPLATTVRRDCQ
jgi:hypothetical protein